MNLFQSGVWKAINLILLVFSAVFLVIGLGALLDVTVCLMYWHAITDTEYFGAAILTFWIIPELPNIWAWANRSFSRRRL